MIVDAGQLFKGSEPGREVDGGGRPGSGIRSSVFFVAFLPSYRAELTE